MDNMKIDAFKYITKRIDNRCSIIESVLNEKKIKNISDEKILFDTSNNETSCSIIKYGANTTTNTIIDDKLKRITCLSGEINLIIPQYDEKIKLKSQDSQLIPSNTYHIIEAIKPSEIIIIYKNKMYADAFDEKITKKETIYNKIL
jgi:hypothetical protein